MTVILICSSFQLFLLEEAVARRRGGYLSNLLQGVLGTLDSSGGKPSYTGSVLSLYELKSCVTQSVELDDKDNKLQPEEALLKDMAKEVEDAEKYLNSLSDSVNRYSKSEVDEYNKKVRNAKLLNNRFNEAVKHFNQNADSLNMGVKRYNTECAGKHYYLHDLRTAERELGISLIEHK